MTLPFPVQVPVQALEVQTLEVQAADALRRLALDQTLKTQVLETPALYAPLYRMARRYVVGETLEEMRPELERAEALGHRTTVDFMGESVLDEAAARTALEEFFRLVQALELEGATQRSISLDLSHIGLTVDRELCLEGASRLAQMTAQKGLELMVSMEGSDRTEAILAVHEVLCAHFSHVGITVQARLLRTWADLDALLERPGRIRLVKGAFDEPETVALRRENPQTAQRYLELAQKLLSSGHLCSIATRDPVILGALCGWLEPKNLHNYEFEMLYGLTEGQLERLHSLGHPTRLYLVYGREWVLYLLNRLAERPERVFQALVDLGARA